MRRSDDKEIDKLLKILERKTDKKITSVKAEKSDKKKKPKKERSVHPNQYRRIARYLEENGLSTGKYYYPNNIMFGLFKDWEKRREIKGLLMSLRTFTSLMKMMLKYKVTNRDKTFFGIDKDLRDQLSPKRMAALNRWNPSEKAK